jgi:SNF2 family DNA or RNA helicase
MKSKSTTTKTRRLQPSGPQKWTPHAYQKKALKFLLEHQAAGLLLDPGLGKTSITLAAFSFLKKKGLAKKMLVIAPLRPCYLVWPAEIEGWEDFAHLKCVVLHGKHKDKLLEEDADVYIINPEGLEWLIGKGTFNRRRWNSLGFDTLCIDELTRFKKSTGKRFKLLKLVLDTFQRRWGLTGTPAPNGLLDLFGQMFILDSGRSLGRYVTHYRMQYFNNPDGLGWKWIPRKGAEEEIYERLKPLCLRMEAKDYLELPDLITNKIMLDMPPKVAEMYDQLEDLMISKLEDNLIVASNAAAASTKLRQICNGAVYVDDDVASFARGSGGRNVLPVHSVKLEAVEELLEELQGQPLLLAYEFNHDLDRLLGHFGKDTPYIGSGVSPKKSAEIEKKWNAGDIPLLLGHPASMGHGLNFQRGNAAHVGWFGMFWDLELYDQFLKRVYRQGNKATRVFNHHFMMQRPGGDPTVDELVFYAQRRKERGQQALSDALKQLVRGRK